MHDLTQLDRRDVLAAVVLAALLCAAAGPRLDGVVCGEYHDDAIYVVTAKALAEGEGYRLTNLPGSPPQTKYPVLYPALLALVWKAWPHFPDNLIALKAVSLVFGALALALCYLYLVRFGYASRRAAFAGVALAGTGYHFVLLNTVTMAEMPFALLTLVALWRLELTVRDPQRRTWQALLDGVLLGLPYLCRSVGLAFVPVGLWLARRRGPTAAGCALVVLPWLAWSAGAWRAGAYDPVEGYYTDYAGWWLSLGATGLAQVVLVNAVRILLGLGSLGTEGASFLLQRATPPVWAVVFALLGLVAAWRLVVLARQRRVLGVAALAYLALVLVWPWDPDRFLLPLAPAFAAVLLDGLGRLVPARAAAWAVGTAVLAANVLILVRWWATPIQRPGQAHGLVAWGPFSRTFDWIGRQGEGDVVLAANDPMVFLYSGRQAYFPSASPPLSLFYGAALPEEVLRQGVEDLDRRRPRFLLVTPEFDVDPTFRAFVAYLRQHHPDRLNPVHADVEDPRFMVYELCYPSSKDQARAGEGRP